MTQATKGVRKRNSSQHQNHMECWLNIVSGPTTESVSPELGPQICTCLGVSAAGKSKIHSASKHTASEKIKGRDAGVGRGKGEESKNDRQRAHKIKRWPRSLSFLFPHM